MYRPVCDHKEARSAQHAEHIAACGTVTGTALISHRLIYCAATPTNYSVHLLNYRTVLAGQLCVLSYVNFLSLAASSRFCGTLSLSLYASLFLFLLPNLLFSFTFPPFIINVPIFQILACFLFDNQIFKRRKITNRKHVTVRDRGGVYS